MKKPGRPAVPASEKRATNLSVKFTASEFKRVEKASKAAGAKKVGTWARERLLDAAAQSGAQSGAK